uniref:Uncharacterized protein n=1 Tax=Oryza rufipogon TaxID=4529 RepID=A0A0E0RGS9_ORYRU
MAGHGREREKESLRSSLTLVTDPSRRRQDDGGGAKRRVASGSGETAAKAAPFACAKCTQRRRERLGHGPIWAGSARLG